MECFKGVVKGSENYSRFGLCHQLNKPKKTESVKTPLKKMGFVTLRLQVSCFQTPYTACMQINCLSNGSLACLSQPLTLFNGPAL